MCGRFIVIPQDELEDIIQNVQSRIDEKKYTNVSAQYTEAYPESKVPVIIANSSHRLQVETMRWGFPKLWGDKKGVIFNTRADTATDPGKPNNMWKKALAQHRCVIGTYGFYEPHKSEKAISAKTGNPIKQQYIFNFPDSPIVMLAGVYEEESREAGVLGHFSIMTTKPNQWIEDCHHRMPVVLRPGEVTEWLCGDYNTLLDRQDIEMVSKAG